MKNWPSITYETVPWHIDPDNLALIPKSKRRKITATYKAALPAKIAQAVPVIPTDLQLRIQELLMELSRFDAEQRARGYNLPALLLRSESSASSQIENLTSSARNIALAELSTMAPKNALLIASNVQAMEKALALPSGVTKEGILEIHAALMNRDTRSFGGQLRNEQVWIGGTMYSPHEALYVPPVASRISNALEDLIAFCGREDIDPLAKAAIAHAQLETIHPFIDGNGRTGRTLLHKILKDEEVLRYATLPVSAGLLHDIDSYMESLTTYQHGDPTAIVMQLLEALELAVAIGRLTAKRLDQVIDGWLGIITERQGAAIRNLPTSLVEQPVVNSAFIANRLSISTRAATTLINRACEYGMLRPMGNRQRGDFYQSDAIIEILEGISDVKRIRRLAF